jgi:hypothetical protein
MDEPTSIITDRRARNWKYLLTSNSTFQIESIQIIESNTFAQQTINFPRAVALIGLNGTGKTLLLRLIEAAFGSRNISSQGPPFFRIYEPHPKLDAVSPIPIEETVKVTLRTPHGLISHVVDLAIPIARREENWKRDLGDSFSVWYTGPLQAFTDINFMFDNYYNGRDLGSREDPSRELTADELRSVRNILGRSYQRLSVINADADGFKVPYFSGMLQSKEIDSSAMSNGELWVHYINWWIEDIIPEGSSALIDEPEAFLAARSRRPFIDQICAQVLRKKMQLIIGTHSPEILARFPLDNTRMCIADPNGIQVVEPGSLLQIQDIVGMRVPIRGLILVEDDLAKQVLSEIFGQYDVALTREVEIIPAGGASNVIAGLRILRKMSRLSTVGILDADEHDEPGRGAVTNIGPASPPVFSLPGNGSPEEELLSAARRETARIAKNMGRTVTDITIAIDSCRNLDHQYQLRHLSSQLGRTESAIVFMLTQAWLRDARIRRQAETLVKDIRRLLSTN